MSIYDTESFIARTPHLNADMRYRLRTRTIELDWLREYGEARGLANVPELADALQAVYALHMAELAGK